MQTINEKIDYLNKITEVRTKRINEIVKDIKLIDTTNIKLNKNFTPGEKYSKQKTSR